MRTRVIVSLIALPLFFLAVFFTPEWVLPVALSLVSGLAAYEMLHNTGLVTFRPLLFVSIALAAVYVPISFYWNPPLSAFVIPSMVGIFITVLCSDSSVSPTGIFAAFFAILFIPLALGSIVKIRAMSSGIGLVLLPFIAAWGTDTCAYFVGTFFGKHKLSPKISPKKSIEGAIAGTLGCVGITLLFRLVAEWIWGYSYNILLLILIATAGSIIAQIGDLSMSYIKRGLKLKDFGTIMPGHGGILDRFDSVLFTAPFIELLLAYITVTL